MEYKAIFIGEQGSMGLDKGGSYQIEIDKNSVIVSTNRKNDIYVPYGSAQALLKNWKIVCPWEDSPVMPPSWPNVNKETNYLIAGESPQSNLPNRVNALESKLDIMAILIVFLALVLAAIVGEVITNLTK